MIKLKPNTEAPVHGDREQGPQIQRNITKTLFADKPTRFKGKREWTLLIRNINSMSLQNNKLTQYKYDAFNEMICIYVPDIMCISEHEKKVNIILR